MYRKITGIFILLGLISVLAVACDSGSSSSTNSYSDGNTGSSTNNNAAASGNGTNEVHLAASSFVQSSITITKGSKLKLINDTSTVHNIQNGSWDNGQAKPLKEKSAPTVNVMFNGNDTQEVGPFPVAGTYHLYCTIHLDMNLTVIVQ